MSKFNEFFDNWVRFEDSYQFAISAELFNKEQALEELKKDILTWPMYQGVEITTDDLKEDRMRFQFREGWENEDGPYWQQGAKGKGSKPVWLINMLGRKANPS